jgi:hypothetical protein
MSAMFNEISHLDNEFSQAEVVLPVQFHDGRTGTATAEPLRRLMIAVLVDAIRCVQTKFAARRPSIREEFAEARSWIFSNEDNLVFSFKTVCDALEMDANAIRKCLVQWEEKRLAGEKPRMVIRRWPASLARRISR